MLTNEEEILLEQYFPEVWKHEIVQQIILKFNT